MGCPGWHCVACATNLQQVSNSTCTTEQCAEWNSLQLLTSLAYVSSHHLDVHQYLVRIDKPTQLLDLTDGFSNRCKKTANITLSLEATGAEDPQGPQQAIQPLPPVLSYPQGALFIVITFLGTSNASGVQPVVSVQRPIFYRCVLAHHCGATQIVFIQLEALDAQLPCMSPALRQLLPDLHMCRTVLLAVPCIQNTSSAVLH